MDLVTQGSYERRNEKSTIPPALAKDKEIKEEPIQKIQPRIKQNYPKTAETAVKNNNCGFCGQQNSSSSHKCPARTVEYNNCHKMDTSREFAAAKPIVQENKNLTTSKRHTTKRKRVNRKKYNKSRKSTGYYQTKTTITGSN